MRLILFTAWSLAAVVAAAGQTLTLTPSSVQYVSVDGMASARTVAPGGRVTLWADVKPKSGFHVYAPGAKDFMPVALVMTPRAGTTFGKPAYPTSILSTAAGAGKPVPVYSAPFRIAQLVTLARTARSGDTLTLSAAVNYQACDHRLCYPAASIPVTWTLTVQ